MHTLSGTSRRIIGWGYQREHWFSSYCWGSSYMSKMIHTIVYMEILNVVNVKCGRLSASIPYLPALLPINLVHDELINRHSLQDPFFSVCKQELNFWEIVYKKLPQKCSHIFLLNMLNDNTNALTRHLFEIINYIVFFPNTCTLFLICMPTLFHVFHLITYPSWIERGIEQHKLVVHISAWSAFT